MRLGLRLLLCALLGACTAAASTDTASFQARSQAYQAASTPQLCAAYAAPESDDQTNLMLEAELAARGATRCAGRAIATRSAAYFGTPRYARSGVDEGTGGRDLNCADFASGAAAQWFFLSLGGPARDPHTLDGDGDGLVCEWGREARRLSTRSISRPRPVAVAHPAATPRQSSSGGCITGPQGGRYRITASGRKGYGSC